MWVNLHHLFRALPDGGFLWGSERTGFLHLYRYSAEGECLGAVTAGEWMIDSLSAVSTAEGLVYFTATEADPRQRHLYAAPLSGEGEIRRITRKDGLHSVTVDAADGRFIDIFHSLDTPPTCLLYTSPSPRDDR